MKKQVFVGGLLSALVIGCASAPADKAPCACGECACRQPYVVVEDTAGQKAWKMPFQLGLAGYTMHKKGLDETLEIMRAVDLHFLCVKNFHLKYTATDAEIAAFKAKCAKYGVTGYALGPLYTTKDEEVRAYFEFAKRFGAKVIVGVPCELADGREGEKKQRVASRRQLEYIDKLVKEFDIRYAVHNHGPQVPKMFPDVAWGWELIKDLDPRIGFCMDVGWEFGCGRDPAETIRKYGDRIYDIHLKNFAVDIPGGEILSKEVPHSFTTVPMPRGKIDYGKVFKALADVGYDGVCSFEYERDFENNLGGLAESVGYARGVCDTIRVAPRMMPVPAGANTLTDAEKRDGWELLWDGRNVPDKWVGDNASKFERFPEKGWRWANGELWMLPTHAIQNGKWIDLPPEDARLGGGGCIQTRKFYRDFHFKADFKLTEAANSGIKYFFDEKLNSATCEEYQILDSGHPDYNVAGGTHRIGALYDLMPAPKAEEVVRPLGQWNTAEVIAKGPHVEHWLNGVKILEYERGSAAFRAAVAKSKYAKWGKDAAGKPQAWGEIPAGRIHLQDHTDSKVYYCNLKIREL